MEKQSYHVILVVVSQYNVDFSLVQRGVQSWGIITRYAVFLSRVLAMVEIYVNSLCISPSYEDAY